MKLYGCFPCQSIPAFNWTVSFPVPPIIPIGPEEYLEPCAVKNALVNCRGMPYLSSRATIDLPPENYLVWLARVACVQSLTETTIRSALSYLAQAEKFLQLRRSNFAYLELIVGANFDCLGKNKFLYLSNSFTSVLFL